MEKTKVVFFWSGINGKTLKKTRSLTHNMLGKQKDCRFWRTTGDP